MVAPERVILAGIVTGCGGSTYTPLPDGVNEGSLQSPVHLLQCGRDRRPETGDRILPSRLAHFSETRLSFAVYSARRPCCFSPSPALCLAELELDPNMMQDLRNKTKFVMIVVALAFVG